MATQCGRILYERYKELVQDGELRKDIRDYDEAKQAIQDGEELVPSHITFATLDGGNPIKRVFPFGKLQYYFILRFTSSKIAIRLIKLLVYST